MGTTTDTIIHLVAGGMGGTTGAIFTCPLEVVKTRLQSTDSGFGTASKPPPSKPEILTSKPAMGPTSNSNNSGSIRNSIFHPEVARGHMQITVPVANLHSKAAAHTSNISSTSVRWSSTTVPPTGPTSMGVGQCLKHIFVNEGIAGLFKGLGPNLMGVFPSRAIYFWAYNTAKTNVNASLPKANRDTPFVHVTSAAMAGFTASTATNPIWLIKTRLQLDRAHGADTLSIRSCISRIHKDLGIKGFWKGVTASYWGISETVIHFVIYEYLKKQLAIAQNKRKTDEKTILDFAGFMVCGACSKTCATIVAYPHEVARTRLREENSVYRSFWQTLATVYKNEGRKGLYRGLATQLIRQIPNTAIMMSTYELTVYVLTNWFSAQNSHTSNPASHTSQQKNS